MPNSRVGRTPRLKTSLLRPRLLPSRVQLYDGDQTEHNAGGDHRGIGINIFHASSRRYDPETVGYPERPTRNVWRASEAAITPRSSKRSPMYMRLV